jgi:hypothetical protein
MLTLPALKPIGRDLPLGLLLFRSVVKDQRTWSKFRASSLLDGGPLTLRQREIVIARTCALTACEGIGE